MPGQFAPRFSKSPAAAPRYFRPTTYPKAYDTTVIVPAANADANTSTHIPVVSPVPNAAYAYSASGVDPTSLTGLNVLLKADDVGTSLADFDPVTTWSDRSGGGHDVTQATAGSKPTFRTRNANGKPVIAFDGGDYLASSAFASPTQGASVLAVIQMSALDDVYRTLFTHAAAATWTSPYARVLMRTMSQTDGGGFNAWQCAIEDAGLGANFVDTIGPGGVSTSLMIIEFFYDQANLRIFINGTHYQTKARTGVIASSTQPLFIGADTIPGDFYWGNIGEIVYYNRGLNTTEQEQIERYLTGRWLSGNTPEVRVISPAASATANTSTHIATNVVTPPAASATANTTTHTPVVIVISPAASATANTSTHTLSISSTFATTAGAATANTTTHTTIVVSIPSAAAATANTLADVPEVRINDPPSSATANTSTDIPIVTVVTPAGSATANTTTHIATVKSLPAAASATANSTTDVSIVIALPSAALATANTSTHVLSISTSITSTAAAATANTTTHIAIVRSLPSAASSTANSSTDIPIVIVVSPAASATANTTSHTVSNSGTTTVISPAASATANSSTHIQVVTITATPALATANQSTPSITTVTPWLPHTTNLVTVTSSFKSLSTSTKYVSATTLDKKIAITIIDPKTAATTPPPVFVTKVSTGNFVSKGTANLKISKVLVNQFASRVSQTLSVQLSPINIRTSGSIIRPYVGIVIVGPANFGRQTNVLFKTFGSPSRETKLTASNKPVDLTVINLVSDRIFIIP